MSETTATHDPELAELWAALPLGRRSAIGTLRALAEATGIDEAVLEHHWRDALLTEVAQLAGAEIARQFAAAGLEHGPAAEAVTSSVLILATVAARYPQLLHRDAPPASPRVEGSVGAPLWAVLERAQTEGAIRDDVPLEQLRASLLGLLSGTLRAALLSGADLDAAGAAVARLFLEAARP